MNSLIGWAQRMINSRAVLFTSLFVYFSFLFRFDPDIHHDGIMYTPALAFSEGLLPNKDAFAYYGPLSPIIQGVALKLFGANLITIRLLGACVFAFSFTLVFHLLAKRISSNWAFVFTLLAALPTASILPWSSAFTTLANLLAMAILVHYLQRDLKKSFSIHIFVASLIISFSFYIRIHQIIVSLVVLAFFILFRRDKRESLQWFFGFLFGHLLAILMMLYFGTLYGFIMDCIVYPQGVAIIRQFEIAYFVGMMWYPGLTLVTFLIVYILSRIDLNSQFKALFLALVSILAGLVLYYISIIPRTGWVTYRNPKIVAIDGSWMSNVLVGYISATIVIVLFLLILVRKVKLLAPDLAVSLAFGLGVIPQLYPMYDRMHLWLLTPVLMIPAIYYLADTKFWNSHIRRATKYLSLSLMVLQLSTIFSFANTDRVPFKSDSLKFMYATEASVNRIDPSVKMLEKYLGESVVFQCNNAFYAGANMKFQSTSKYYVNWGKPKGYDPKESSDFTFMCNLDKSKFDYFKVKGVVLDYRLLEYFENNKKVIRFNVIMSGYHDGV
jgi:hypothetical protein